MNVKKRVLLWFLSVAMVLSMLPVSVLASETAEIVKAVGNGVTTETTIVSSGTCGENLTWTLDNNGTLTVGGTGSMDEYSESWSDFRNSIRSVVIEDGVTSIKPHAFDGCKLLKEVEIADSVTTIGGYAFQNCFSLKTVKLSKSLIIISNGLFYNCRSLTDVAIPYGVTAIGESAFVECYSLAEIEIPDSVASIESFAFWKCDGLKTLEIPDDVNSIGYGAFCACRNMKAIVFMGDAPDICDNACRELTSTIYYPLKNASWTEEVRRSCGGEVTWVSYEGDYPLLDDEENEGTLSGTCGENLFWSLDSEGTLTISGTGPMTEYDTVYNRSPWHNNSSITKLVVENGVTNIGDWTFSGCVNLTSVAFSNSVSEIRDGAFSCCVNLTSVVLPNSVSKIGGYAFNDCVNLANVEIPDGVTEISNSAFSYCVNLTSIVLPNSVSEIGGCAFDECANLVNIEMPDSMSKIGDCAFGRCKKLGSIKVPEGVTELSSTFILCENLSDVELPSTLIEIGYNTFGGCKSLKTLEIPDGVVLIGGSAFQECTGLTSITIPDTVQVLGDSMFGGAFTFCSNLTSIKIPYGVREIYDNSFRDCSSLRNITIPVTVERIGVSAFYHCAKLTDIYFTGSEEQWNEVCIGDSGNEVLGTVTVHCLETDLKDEFVLENKVRLTEGQYPAWSDRVILPPFAQEFYDWLEESTDGDGESDVLIWSASDDRVQSPYYYRGEVTVRAENAQALKLKLEREEDAALEAMEIAYKIFRHEHPDASFLGTVFGMSWDTEECSDVEGRIMITIDIYYNSIVREEYYESIVLKEETIENILSNLPADMSTYDKVRFFNAYLTRENSYNSDYPNQPDSAHKAITALIGKTGAEGPVCSAYAGAFKLLCDAENIPCAYISGTASGESHAWNVVQMEDGKWYAVDTTWNDPMVSGVTDPISGYESEKWLLIGSETVVYGKRFSDSHIANEDCGINTSFYLTNGPVLSETEYIAGDASQHIEVIDKAELPTCTENGLTEGRHCYICGEILVKQEVVAAGHRFENGVCVCCGAENIIVASGYSGDTTWMLSEPGVLTFSGEGVMKNYTYKSEMPWYEYRDQITSVVIEDGVTRIGSYAFYGMPNLESITIPETVTTIGDYAFKNCSKLDKVVLPSELTTLGDSAFYACSALTSIDIPASLYTVKPYTFKNCTSLASVTFHEGNLQKISDGAFYNTALTEVVLPDCLDILDVYAFKNCSDLASVKLGSGLTQIREAVLYGTAVSTIEIPEGITAIKPYAFKNCSNLVSVTLPSTLVSVDEAAFYACTKLVSVTLPDAVSTIGNYAFRKCTGLTSVSFGSELETIGESSFYGCTGLTELVIPAKVTTIQGYAFKGCTGLTAVTLPDSLITIGDSAFHTCTGLKTIVIPAKVETIGEYCFSGSWNLWQITFDGSAPAIGTGAFKGLAANAYYPGDNATWTSDVMQNYGGNITWKAA